MLLLDADRRPVGWVRVRELSGERPLAATDTDPSSPIVQLGTTLRDALSQMLASTVQTAVVVDDAGRYVGVLTVDDVGEAFRSAHAGRDRTGGSRMRPGEPLILWDWVFSHLPDIRDRRRRAPRADRHRDRRRSRPRRSRSA